MLNVDRELIEGAVALVVIILVAMAFLAMCGMLVGPA